MFQMFSNINNRYTQNIFRFNNITNDESNKQNRLAYVLISSNDFHRIEKRKRKQQCID